MLQTEAYHVIVICDGKTFIVQGPLIFLVGHDRVHGMTCHYQRQTPQLSPIREALREKRFITSTTGLLRLLRQQPRITRHQGR